MVEVEQKSISIRSKNMKCGYFPEDVIAEILCRLPIKSILRCICVCKSWECLIKSYNFNCTFSSYNTRRYFLRAMYDNQPYYLRFDNTDLKTDMLLVAPFHPGDYFRVAGSCNGVICLVGRFRDCKVILWNPIIRKSLSLPDSILGGASIAFLGCGFDSRTHDCKVLRILNLGFKPKIEVRAELYSVNSNSWKDITRITPNYFVYEFATSAFLNGALHWIVADKTHIYGRQQRKLILKFDVSDEAFHEIPLPECIENVFHHRFDLSILAFEATSIAVIHQDRNAADYQSDIWVMKEYGVVESWMKLATVGEQCRGPSRVMGFRSNGEALIGFDRDGILVSQKLNSHQVKNFMAFPRYEEPFYNYVESLVLLDKGNDEGASDGLEFGSGLTDAK